MYDEIYMIRLQFNWHYCTRPHLFLLFFSHKYIERSFQTTIADLVSFLFLANGPTCFLAATPHQVQHMMLSTPSLAKPVLGSMSQELYLSILNPPLLMRLERGLIASFSIPSSSFQERRMLLIILPEGIIQVLPTSDIHFRS